MADARYFGHMDIMFYRGQNKIVMKDAQLLYNVY